jgi:hypothetical protein
MGGGGQHRGRVSWGGRDRAGDTGRQPARPGGLGGDFQVDEVVVDVSDDHPVDPMLLRAMLVGLTFGDLGHRP